jgi:hypothetical protein
MQGDKKVYTNWEHEWSCAVYSLAPTAVDVVDIGSGGSFEVDADEASK